MPISKTSRALVATATLALLAGCSGGTSTSPVSPVGSQSASHQTVGVKSFHHHSGLSTLIHAPNLAQILKGGGMPHFVKGANDFAGTAWVTDAGTNSLYKVSAKGKIKSIADPTGVGWSEPQGVGVDASGNVYIADTENTRVVELSKKGALVAVLADTPGCFPVGVAISGNTVGVTNIFCEDETSPYTFFGGSVSYYVGGATSPTSQSANGYFYEAFFIGADREGNFYVDGYLPVYYTFYVGYGTQASGTFTADPNPISLEFPGGVNVLGVKGKKHSVAETLAVGDQEALTVQTQSLPSFGSGATTTLGGGSDEVQWTTDKKETVAGAADAGEAAANFWAFPAGGSEPAATVSGFSEPIGIGITPSFEN
jgi:hypothetical protein